MKNEQFLFAIALPKRPKHVQQQIRERVKECRCVECGDLSIGPRRLGLCTQCYSRHRNTRPSHDPYAACLYDAERLREGILLTPQEIRFIQREQAKAEMQNLKDSNNAASKQ